MGRHTIGTAEEIEAKLRAGGEDAWLSPGELAVIFGKHRSSIDRWLTNTEGVRLAGRRWRIRVDETAGGHRLCNPEDVIAMLDAQEESRRTVGRTVRRGRGSDDQGRSGT